LFQDFNQEVLEYCTELNVKLNCSDLNNYGYVYGDWLNMKNNINS
jgi:hypothetical protein